MTTVAKMRKFKWRTNTIVLLALLSVAITTLYPLFYVVMTSSRTLEDYNKNAYGLPKFFTLDSYRILINNYSLDTAARNTIIVVGLSLATSLIFSSLAGFALAKYDFPGSKAINWSFIAVMLLPSQILIIPIYLLLSKFSLVGHLPGLMFVYIGTNIPFGVFFLKSTFNAVPDTILDAARIDGAGFFTSFFRIAIPNAAAGITTLAVLQFLGMWNELLYAYLILPDQEMRLLTPALASIGGRYTTNQPLVAAALCITATPTIILLAMSSKYLVRGVPTGTGSS
jgi:ABC-type glycerol-3-phosphate transport system permease component